MKPTHLRGLLVLLVIVGQIASICFVLVGTHRQTREQFTVNAEQTLDDFAKRVADQSQRYLVPAITAVTVAQRLIDQDVISAFDDVELERYFLAKLESVTSLGGLYLGRPDGSFLFVSREPDGLRTKRISIDEGERSVQFQQYSDFTPPRIWTDSEDTYDPRARPWYLDAIESESLIWTEPYMFFTSGRPGISAAINLSNQAEETIGVIGVDVYISDLSSFIEMSGDDYLGSAIIVDENRHVIAYSSGSYLNSIAGLEAPPLLEDITDGSLSALHAQRHLSDVSASETSGEITRIMDEGVAHIGLTRGFSIQGSSASWTLLAQIPEAEYSGGVIELLHNNLWFLIATVLLPGIILAAVIMRLTAPLERYYREASVDQLTGALTRNEFFHRLAKITHNVRRNDRESQVVVVVLDLDGFKAVNDEYDHSVGDLVLSEIAKRLRMRIREGELVGRLGGDEFVLALRVHKGIDYMEIVESVRRRAVEDGISSPHGIHVVGLTAGVARWREGESAEELVQRADQALMRGKKSVKNRCYHESDMDDDGPDGGGNVLSIIR